MEISKYRSQNTNITSKNNYALQQHDLTRKKHMLSITRTQFSNKETRLTSATLCSLSGTAQFGKLPKRCSSIKAELVYLNKR